MGFETRYVPKSRGLLTLFTRDAPIDWAGEWTTGGKMMSWTQKKRKMVPGSQKLERDTNLDPKGDRRGTKYA